MQSDTVDRLLTRECRDLLHFKAIPLGPALAPKLVSGAGKDGSCCSSVTYSIYSKRYCFPDTRVMYRFSLKDFVVKKKDGGLPWWLSGNKSTSQCRRHGFDPWSRKIPQATEQLSWCATTTEPVLQAWELQLRKPERPKARAQ